MKPKLKKINSIGYGGKILFAAVLFGAVIPVVIGVVSFFAESAVLTVCAKISFAIGVAIAVFLIALLSVELHQDKKLNDFYQSHSNVKTVLGNGFCECPSCGNKKVKPSDKHCAVCGVTFEK